MAVAVGEPHHLVLDARAVAWAAGLDLAGEHRGPVEVGPDEVVDLGARPRDPADHLLLLDPVGEERERLRVGVTGLHFEPREVDRRGREPAGRAGLEAVDRDAGPLEGLAHARRGALPRPATGGPGLARVHHGLEKGARGEHDRRGVVFGVAADANADDPPGRRAVPRARDLLEQQVLDRLLAEVEVHGLLDDPLDLHLVEPLVGLGPRPVHRRPLGAVEDAELDAGGVDRPPHHAAERVHLADELRLAHAADRRVAAHLPDGVAVGGQQRRAGAEPGGGAGRFHPGMAGSDHEHVIVVGAAHGFDGKPGGLGGLAAAGRLCPIESSTPLDAKRTPAASVMPTLHQAE